MDECFLSHVPAPCQTQPRPAQTSPDQQAVKEMAKVKGNRHARLTVQQNQPRCLLWQHPNPPMLNDVVHRVFCNVFGECRCGFEYLLNGPQVALGVLRQAVDVDKLM